MFTFVGLFFLASLYVSSYASTNAETTRREYIEGAVLLFLEFLLTYTFYTTWNTNCIVA